MSIDFSDTSSSKNGLLQECERALFGGDYGAITGNTKKLATFTYYINEGLSRFNIKVMEADTRWQFHDANYTTLPEAYTDLVASQNDYELSDLHLQLRHVYVLNSAGKKVPLKPVDEYDTASHGVALDEMFSTDGMPQYYDKKGRSIKLYPAPSASETTLTGGLYVTYTSSMSYFATSDTTKEAGIPIPFHNYPAIYACEMYAKRNRIEAKAREFQIERLEMEESIQEFYNRRDKDDKPRLRVRRKNYA